MLEWVIKMPTAVGINFPGIQLCIEGILILRVYNLDLSRYDAPILYRFYITHIHCAICVLRISRKFTGLHFF